MVKTLHAVIAEHFTDLVTNADHPKSILMVVQWTLAMRDRLVDDEVPRQSLGSKSDEGHYNLPSKLCLESNIYVYLTNHGRYEVLVSEGRSR